MRVAKWRAEFCCFCTIVPPVNATKMGVLAPRANENSIVVRGETVARIEIHHRRKNISRKSGFDVNKYPAFPIE